MSIKRPLKLFFDRCFGGRRLKSLLAQQRAEIEIRLHDEVLPRDADDFVWIEWAASEGYVAVTCDLLRSEFQRTALASYRGLVIIFPELPVEMTASLLLRSLSRIRHLVTQRQTGCFKISAMTGRLVRRWRK